MYVIDHSIIDYSNEDEFSLSTKRENTYVSHGKSVIQFEPGLVLDIVLDDTHPKFSSGALGEIIIGEDFPADFSGNTPSNSDLDYFSIGSALVRLCYSQQKVEKENLIWAVPLDSNFSTFPLLNEVVHVVKIFDKFYYTNKANTKNNCNTSADFRYEQTYGKMIGNRSYDGVELTGPESKFDSIKGQKTYSGFRGILGKYFWFNNKIKNLRRFEGDTVMESRFGQSIRMGSYDDNRSNDTGFYDDYKSGDSEDNLYFGGGNPSILIRNRQRPVSRVSEQRLHPLLNPILPISSSLNEKNSGGYLIEDINNDGSSIHITSGLTISPFRTTCYKSIFSKSKPEEQSKFSPSNSTEFVSPILNKDQIVINSDRLIFSSRFNETLHFSKKRYMIATDSEYTVDAHDQIVLTTNQKTVINSPAIYLGEYNNTNEPALLGQTSVDWLYDLCQWLLVHTHKYVHSHPDAGGAEPDVTQYPVEVRQLISLRDKLHTLMSRRVFLTGGGYANGADGGNITDGSKPLKINVYSGDGVPGGWKGKNRR